MVLRWNLNEVGGTRWWRLDTDVVEYFMNEPNHSSCFECTRWLFWWPSQGYVFPTLPTKCRFCPALSTRQSTSVQRHWTLFNFQEALQLRNCSICLNCPLLNESPVHSVLDASRHCKNHWFFLTSTPGKILAVGSMNCAFQFAGMLSDGAAKIGASYGCSQAVQLLTASFH